MLSLRLSDQQHVVDFLSARVRREKDAAKGRRRYARRCVRVNEDIAFCLFCTHDHSDIRFRRCLESIVSLSPNVDAEALLRRIENRYMQTPLGQTSAVAMGHGGGIGAREHRFAKKLWKQVSILSWVADLNMEGGAPTGIEVFNKLAGTVAQGEVEDELILGRSLSNNERTKVSRVMKHLGCSSGMMPTPPRLPRAVAREKVHPIVPPHPPGDPRNGWVLESTKHRRHPESVSSAWRQKTSKKKLDSEKLRPWRRGNGSTCTGAWQTTPTL